MTQMIKMMKKRRIGQKFKFRFVYLQPIVGPAEHFLQTFFIRHWWLDLRRGRYINFSWRIHCHYLSLRACIWILHFLGFGSLLIWIMSHECGTRCANSELFWNRSKIIRQFLRCFSSFFYGGDRCFPLHKYTRVTDTVVILQLTETFFLWISRHEKWHWKLISIPCVCVPPFICVLIIHRDNRFVNAAQKQIATDFGWLRCTWSAYQFVLDGVRMYWATNEWTVWPLFGLP